MGEQRLAIQASRGGWAWLGMRLPFCVFVMGIRPAVCAVVRYERLQTLGRVREGVRRVCRESRGNGRGLVVGCLRFVL